MYRQRDIDSMSGYCVLERVLHLNVYGSLSDNHVCALVCRNSA